MNPLTTPSAFPTFLPTPTPVLQALQQGLFAFQQSQVLLCAWHSGLLPYLAQHPQGASVTAMAQALSLPNPVHLQALLHLLQQQGVVQLTEGPTPLWQLERSLQPYLEEGHPLYVGPWFAHAQHTAQVWQSLTPLLSHGALGGTPFSLEEAETRFATLNPLFNVLHYPLAQAVVSALTPHVPPPSSAAALQVLDVGAGSGVWSLALAEAFPHLHTTLLDYPAVVEQAQHSLEQAVARGQKPETLLHRTQYLPQPLEQAPLANEAYDVVLLGLLLHPLGSVEAMEEALAMLWHSLKPQGLMVVIERLEGEAALGHPAAAALAELTFGLSPWASALLNPATLQQVRPPQAMPLLQQPLPCSPYTLVVWQKP